MVWAKRLPISALIRPGSGNLGSMASEVSEDCTCSRQNNCKDATLRDTHAM